MYVYDVEYYCGNKPADVVFLLDTSNSIWGPDFTRQLAFVNNVISMFKIASNVTRVGITTFSSQVHREFYLNSYFSKDSMRSRVSSIRQTHGYHTNTGLAIWHMRHRMFSPRRGSRPDVAKIGIVLTDGQSSSIGKTLMEAKRTKRKKITMFAIGIGSNINERELQGIASSPSSEYVFKVDGYSALDAIKNSLAVRTCRGDNRR
ncbi:COLA1-like protein [Mya arenaria]|uniref:COLA1-like protein n=1 Tax=Mya arenaria TaxID=6604 RepID=A0ABY7E178_MYAAR|nr:COLA1-like protein [Mya arenaria]